MSIIKITWNGKVRGWFDTESKTYTTPRTAEHYCVKYHGWGVQADIIDFELKTRGCKTVRIEYHGNDITNHDTDFNNYIEHGKREALNIADGIQVFLNETYFKKPEKPSPNRAIDDFISPKSET
jgi:hypothetical protein